MISTKQKAASCIKWILHQDLHFVSSHMKKGIHAVFFPIHSDQTNSYPVMLLLFRSKELSLGRRNGDTFCTIL